MDEITLLPRPRMLQPEVGSGPRSVSAVTGSSSAVARSLAGRHGLGLVVENVGVAEFSRRSGLLPPAGFTSEEGYALKIDGGGVLLGSDTPRARFYGEQTLGQIVAGCARAEGAALPRLHCFDWPRMPLRGFTLCYHIVGDAVPLMAPNAEAALRAIQELAHLKMNTLVIELEAMFPYRRHPSIAAKNAFTPGQVEQIRRACEEAHVQIVPLIQSIGHAYAVLRHAEYAHLRELPDTSQQYCLCSDAVRDFYAELASEVIDAFGARRLHIGGDESRRLGQCPRCREKAARVGIGGLYADHVNAVAEGLLRRGVTPMVWGDIMEDHPDILDTLDPRVEVI
jgi:N-acetyl-beta-hexosaminidase